MKQIIILFLLFSFTSVSFSQQNEPVSTNGNVDYLKKSKNQNTAAWILTSGGAIAVVVAFAHDLNNIFTDANSLTGLYIAGGAMIGSSIILFSAAAKNKRKAATSTVSFNTRFIMEKSMIKTNKKNFPALGISIGF